jgi:uncharacterized protein
MFGEEKVLDQNQSPKLGHPPFTNRKASSRKTPRKRLPWPSGKPFKILSLDGGGIRGIYTACLLHKIESELCNGSTIGDFFDLVAGTSTGGIIAVGIGFSLPTEKIVDLYLRDGGKIFPQKRFEQSQKWWSKYFRDAFLTKYDHTPLETALFEVFGKQTLGQSKSRLVIPSCMVPKSEIAVFKTDHHEDYKRDHTMAAWEVCRATSAAPTFFAGHERNGRMFVDGGLWANNPIMVAATEALSCFEIEPSQIQILSIGTGNKPFELSLKEARGGWFQWKLALTGAMHLSTDSATSQVGLFIGDENVARIEPEYQIAEIQLDDWVEAKRHLPDAAEISFRETKPIIEPFFKMKVEARSRFYANN